MSLKSDQLELGFSIYAPYIDFVYLIEPTRWVSSNTIFLRTNTTKEDVMSNHNLFDRSHYNNSLSAHDKEL